MYQARVLELKDLILTEEARFKFVFVMELYSPSLLDLLLVLWPQKLKLSVQENGTPRLKRVLRLTKAPQTGRQFPCKARYVLSFGLNLRNLSYGCL